MKINLALILSIIGAVGVVAFGFTAFQIYSERQQLNTELEVKTISIAEDFYSNHFKNQESDSVALTNITDSVISQYSFSGIAIYYNADSIVPLNKAAASLIEHSEDYISQAVAADSSMGNKIDAREGKFYEYIIINY